MRTAQEWFKHTIHYYGTETGNSRWVAETIAGMAAKRGVLLRCRILSTLARNSSRESATQPSSHIDLEPWQATVLC
jgi:hypothetical protein